MNKPQREVTSVTDKRALDHVGCFTLVAPDPMAGRTHRYSVIRVDYQTGQARCIGREIPLKLAREVAKSPAPSDLYYMLFPRSAAE